MACGWSPVGCISLRNLKFPMERYLFMLRAFLLLDLGINRRDAEIAEKSYHFRTKSLCALCVLRGEKKKY